MPRHQMLRAHVDRFLQQSRALTDPSLAWRKLELAHVISQPSPWLHTRVHWAMLRFGLVQRDGREVLGQLFRLSVAALGSALGRYPVGNTGRARVSAFAPMSMPPEARAVLEGLRQPSPRNQRQ